MFTFPWTLFSNSNQSSPGNVYVGGVFTTAGGVPVNGIAKWDGSNWSALGSGFNTGSNCRAIRVY